MKKVAVITPCYKEDIKQLQLCHESVLAQAPDTSHFFVADGHPNPAINDWTCKHVILPTSHGDSGNSPRSIGALMVLAEDYEFIAYLDADNWYHQEHVAGLLSLHERTGASMCCSFRSYHALDGTKLNAREADEENLNHVDTSCIMLHRSASRLATLWALMPKKLSPICDRIFLAAARHFKTQISSNRAKSVAFRSKYINHYIQAGAQPPEYLKGQEEIEPSLNYLYSREGIDECQRQLGFWP